MLFCKTADDAAEIASFGIVTLLTSGMRYTGETETLMKDGKAEVLQYSMSKYGKSPSETGTSLPENGKNGRCKRFSLRFWQTTNGTAKITIRDLLSEGPGKSAYGNAEI